MKKTFSTLKGIVFIALSAFSIPMASGCGYVCKWPVKHCKGMKRAVTFESVDPSTSKIIWEPSSSLVGEDRNISLSPEETTTYHFKIEGCEQEFSITIPVINPMTDVTPAIDTIVCPGSPAVLHVNVSEQAESIKWFTKEGHNPVGTGNDFVVNPQTSTVYEAEVSDGACPDVTVEMEVSTSEPPRIDSVIKQNDQLVMISGIGGVGSLQYSTNGNDFSSDAQVVADANSAQHYYVKDEMGCASDTIIRPQLPQIKFPTVLTPNGDGVNDVFKIENLEKSCPDAKISIYDRTGKKIIEYNYDQAPWDGTYKGKPLASGDYWYKVMMWDRYEPYTGHITLMRDK